MNYPIAVSGYADAGAEFDSWGACVAGTATAWKRGAGRVIAMTNFGVDVHG